MCGKYKLHILILFAISGSSAVNLYLRNCTTPKNSTETKISMGECPANSKCLLYHETFKCICIQNFRHYEIPASLPKDENVFHQPYCRPRNVSDSSTPSANGEPKVMIYTRSPAKTEHLLYAIFLILLAVIFVVTIVYVVKLFKPLKRTKVAYVKLKRRRNNHKPLDEEQDGEIYEGIAMTRRNDDAQYY